MNRHVRFTLLAVLAAMGATLAAQQQIMPPVPLQGNSPITTNSVPGDQTKVSTDARRLKLADAYAKLPLSFEFNHDQTDGTIRFFSRGPGYSLFLTPTEAVLGLRGLAEPVEIRPPATRRAATTAARPSTRTAVLRMKLLGSNPQPSATALEELPGKSNYFIGNDPKQWRINVPNYGRVRFGDVYPGVDLVYYGNQSQLEYDFVVAPGADPSAIRLGFVGTEQMQIDSQGELTLQMRTGEVRWHKPIVYQEIDGVRQIVGSQYVRKGKKTVGFEVASYDPRHALIIDPTLDYSTYLGGNVSTTGAGIAVDPSGHAYVTGYTLSVNNIAASVGAYQGALAGGQDAFVTKIDTTRFGSASRIYSTYLGGSGTDAGLGIAVDSSGNAYITGDTGSLNFPTFNAYQAAFQGGPGGLDAFVAKLNAAGNALLYSTYLGGNQNDVGHGIAVDSSNPPNGYAYVTGDAISSNFPTLNGFQNSGYGFVTKLNTLLSGVSSLVYSTYMDSDARAIAADSSGNVYVTGIFGGGAGLSALCLVSYCNDSGVPIPRTDKNAFVMKVNTNASGLSSLVYYTYVGGGNDDVGSGIAVDSSGSAYVTGTTNSVDFVGTITSFVSPKVNSIQSTNGGGNDAFIFKLNPSGDGLLYSTYLGGTGDDEGSGIAVDSLGNAFVTGFTSSKDGTFPILNALDGQSSPLPGPNAGFVTKINASGTAWLYSTYLGGSNGNFATGIALDSLSNAYIIGGTTSSNLPVANAFQFNQGGISNVTPNAFVARIGHAQTYVTNVTTTTPNGSYGTGASIDIEITFTDVINVTGTPQLALNSGGIASYSSGSGTNTLTFTYVVGAGQNSSHLDYTSTTALTLNGGTFADGATNPPDLTLPTPGGAGYVGVVGSLSANANIEIDTGAPTVISYSVVFGTNSTFNLIGSTRTRLPWQISGIRVVFSTPIASADINSLSGVSATGISGLGTNTLTWSISPITLGSISTMLAGSGSDAIKDASGNALSGGAGYAQNFKVLQGDFNDDGFVASNDMSAVWNATAQAYNVFADINGDGVVNLTDVLIVRSRIGTSLP